MSYHVRECYIVSHALLNKCCSSFVCCMLHDHICALVSLWKLEDLETLFRFLMFGFNVFHLDI